MNFRLNHTNFNVLDLDKSVKFYSDALGLHVQNTVQPENGSFKIVFMTDDKGEYRLELTYVAEHTRPYDLGEGEFHLAVTADDYQAAHALHEKMGCICFENPAMGLYFISDPDGYWIEILPR